MRCLICNKKNIMNLKCRCDHFFCQKHLLPEIHGCSYDYTEKTKLEEKLVKVVKEKVDNKL